MITLKDQAINVCSKRYDKMTEESTDQTGHTWGDSANNSEEAREYRFRDIRFLVSGNAGCVVGVMGLIGLELNKGVDATISPYLFWLLVTFAVGLAGAWLGHSVGATLTNAAALSDSVRRLISQDVPFVQNAMYLANSIGLSVSVVCLIFGVIAAMFYLSRLIW